MLANRIIAGGAAALVVAGAFVALVSGGRSPTTREPTAASSNRGHDGGVIAIGGTIDAVSRIRRCTQSTSSVAIEIRRPTPSQINSDGVYAATAGARPVATIVVRNVGADDCRFAPGAFRLVIRDRRGKVVGAWDHPAWFAGIYRPGADKQFSLPAVLRCDRPGPFVALATVDSSVAHSYYTVIRDNLSRRQITC